MSSRLSERLNVYGSGVWVSAATFSQFVGVATLVGADAAETVTATLRKATNAAGANAADAAPAVVQASAGADVTIKAAADVRSDELGYTAGGVPFTHVSLTVADSGDTETATGVLIAGDARFSGDTLAGQGLAGF